jgi:hypothetical protein
LNYLCKQVLSLSLPAKDIDKVLCTDGPVLSTAQMFVTTQQRASCPPQGADQSAATMATSMISAASVLGISRPDQNVQSSSGLGSLAQISVCGEVRFHSNFMLFKCIPHSFISFMPFTSFSLPADGLPEAIRAFNVQGCYAGKT